MTLAVQNRIVRYAGNSSTTSFAIPFSFYSTAAAVEVTLMASNGTETLQVSGVDYNISSTNVVMVSAPATNTTLIIRSNLDLAQTAVDFTDNVPFLPTTVEDGIDRTAAMLQQLGEIVGRCIRFKKGSTSTNVEYQGSKTASTVLAWDSGGTYLTDGPTTADISNAVTYAANAATSASSAASSSSAASTSASTAASSASASAVSAAASAASAATAAAAAATVVGTAFQEVLVGTFSTDTTYTLTHTPNSSAGVLAILGTNPQAQGTDYTISGSTITFAGIDTSARNLLVFYRY